MPSAAHASGALVDALEFERRAEHNLRECTRALVHLESWLREEIEASDQALSERARSYLKSIGVLSRRLHAMIENIALYRKLTREDPPREGNSLLSAINIRLAALSSQHDFGHRIQGDDLNIAVSTALINHALHALLHNAIHHNHTGLRSVDIALSSTKRFAKIQISDTCEVIPEAQYKRIFQPLVTLNARDQVEGTGLGLAISSRIATLYGGQLSVRSRPSSQAVGNQFELTLPLAH